jgi:predicted nuclease of predicted toxin-antitoxin system
MRFLLDNDVDVVVARMLRRHGHTCWVAAQAGLADVPDDLIAIYAEKLDAALVSHDRRFAKRRMRNTRGQHVWMACLQVDAIEVLERHLDEVVKQLTLMPWVVLEVSAERVRVHPPKWR